MAEHHRGRRNILQTRNDSELLKRCRLDRAGMFVVDLIRDALTSPTKCNNSRMKEITTSRYLTPGKMQQRHLDPLQLSISIVIE